MAEYLVQGESITAVADAIREKGGTTAPLSFPEGMASAVRDIPASVGIKVLSPNLHDKATDTGNIYPNNGKEQEFEGWSVTDYIPIEEEAVYAVSLVTSKTSFAAKYYALYDAGKAYPKNLDNNAGIWNAGKGSFVTLKPGVTGYIRFSGMDNSIQNLHYYKCSGNIDDSDIVNDLNI